MKRSNKIILTAVAIVGISVASISLVSAQGRYDRCGYGGDSMSMQRGFDGERGHHKFNRGMKGDPAARMEQRLDMMKYKLRITEEQEPVWQAFAQQVKQKMENRLERREAMRDNGRPTVSERVKQMRTGAEQMNEMADVIEKLYASLTPEQQKIADQMRPMGGKPRMR
ncbi:Spy/CpxP family protein refolding chaperone [Sedimenticola thiotaurini]|uniref:Spy/CpxP family protein refolding chaperone n=1 Tax=Sedimenticola thiotaurini TaxID=1543721 RepID=A0A0F7JVR8_9GAMM|nr:Spy/CpxP family protein refolding chaperone [Sedimenticola thiotaurini]AKH19459.1 hypothetical protein AAY24_02850 [Sedimenticola thiotaurini]